jgi:hypothetical protein
MRQSAQDEGKLGGGFFCSPLKDNEDKLAGVEDAAGARISDGDGSAALRCGQGAAPTGARDENLRQHKFGEPLANPRSKEGERRSQSFTGGDEFTAEARNRGGGKGGRVA